VKTLRNTLDEVSNATATQEREKGVEEKLRFHSERCSAENSATGMASEEEALAALKSVGNVQTTTELGREVHVGNFLEPYGRMYVTVCEFFARAPGLRRWRSDSGAGNRREHCHL